MLKKVGDVMIRNVKTVNIDDIVLKAAEVMNRYEIGCVIVTDNGSPVGILTERDILKRIIVKGRDPVKTKVKEVMSKPLIIVKPHVKITRAIQVMIKERIKKLAVTNADNLVGVLSLTDLIPLLETQKSISKLSLKGAPKRVKKVFEIYYDPKRKRRKTCPLTMARGMAVSCLGLKCMWYVADRCVFLNLAEKISS
jgi:CBS domain-containing protein